MKKFYIYTSMVGCLWFLKGYGSNYGHGYNQHGYTHVNKVISHGSHGYNHGHHGHHNHGGHYGGHGGHGGYGYGYWRNSCRHQMLDVIKRNILSCSTFRML